MDLREKGVPRTPCFEPYVLGLEDVGDLGVLAQNLGQVAVATDSGGSRSIRIDGYLARTGTEEFPNAANQSVGHAHKSGPVVNNIAGLMSNGTNLAAFGRGPGQRGDSWRIIGMIGFRWLSSRNPSLYRLLRISWSGSRSTLCI